MRGVLLLPLLLLGALAACSSDTVSVLRGDPRLFIGASETQTYDFGRVQAGLTASVDITIKNPGAGTAQITRITGAELTGAQWSYAIPTQAFTLTAGAEKVVKLTFTPFAAFEEPARLTLRFETDAALADGPGTTRTLTLEVTGRGAASGLLIEPNPVDFGTLVGGFKDLDIKITNQLTTPTPLTTVRGANGKPSLSSVSGPGRFEFTQAVESNGSLLPGGRLMAPGEVFTLRARYIPDPAADRGQDRATLTVSNCAEPVCAVSVQLLGRSRKVAVECLPATLDFGKVNPGARITKGVTCTNLASEPILLDNWEPAIGSDPAFEVAPYVVGPALAEGESRAIEVAFAPTAATLALRLPVRGKLVVSPVRAADRAPLTALELGLIGQAGGPDVKVTPAALSFGPLALNTDRARRLSISNEGDTDLNVSGVTIAGSGASSFAAVTNPLLIAPGQSEVVEVTFSPLMEGTITDTLLIATDDADSPEVRVPLSGEGVVLPPCQYTAQPTRVGFGIVPVATQASLAVLLQNTGTERCLFSDFAIQNASGDAFSLSALPADPLYLAAGDSAIVRVGFNPTAAGTFTADLGFYVSALNSRGAVPISGEGSTTALIVSPREIDFGTTGANCSTRTRRVTIYNPLSTSVNITRVALSAGSSTEFRLENLPPALSAPPGFTLVGGGAVEFDVRYRPADLGVDVATIEVLTSQSMLPYVVSLLGRATTAGINVDTFRQVERASVDVLFVVDNSCSMADNQVDLATNFASFIRNAEAQSLDYRIAVVTTDADGVAGPGSCPSPPPALRPSNAGQGSCGYFADGSFDGTTDPAWRIVTPDELPSPVVAFQNLANQSTVGSGDEKTLEAAYQALSAPMITNWNAGFLRREASLAIIMVTDEREDSLRPVDFYVNFLFSIKGASNRDRFSGSVIGPTRDASCPSQDGLDPIRHHDFVARTGGIFEPICTANWADTLENLGLAVFGYNTSFSLSNEPIPSTLSVTVDGVPTPQDGAGGIVSWRYDRASAAVKFTPIATPEPGSEIVVTYASECLR